MKRILVFALIATLIASCAVKNQAVADCQCTTDMDCEMVAEFGCDWKTTHPELVTEADTIDFDDPRYSEPMDWTAED